MFCNGGIIFIQSFFDEIHLTSIDQTFILNVKSVELFLYLLYVLL